MDDRVKAIVRGSILRIINENVTDQKVQQLFAKGLAQLNAGKMLEASHDINIIHSIQ